MGIEEEQEEEFKFENGTQVYLMWGLVRFEAKQKACKVTGVEVMVVVTGGGEWGLGEKYLLSVCGGSNPIPGRCEFVGFLVNCNK